MSKENLIIWQKWADPFDRDNDAIAQEEEFNNFYEEENSDIDMDEEEKKDNKISEFVANQKLKFGIKVIATPMGIIPVNEHTASGKIFNFWMGHTNFDITKKIAETIEKTEGVETLDIYTRYRFRISVGKAFDDSVVMRKINNNVYKEINYAN